MEPKRGTEQGQRGAYKPDFYTAEGDITCISFGRVGACDIRAGNPGHSLGFFVRRCGSSLWLCGFFHYCYQA